MAKSRSSEAVDKLLDITSQGGQCIGSAEDRAEDVGGIIHYEHIQLYVSYSSSAYYFSHQNIAVHGPYMLRWIAESACQAFALNLRRDTICSPVEQKYSLIRAAADARSAQGVYILLRRPGIHTRPWHLEQAEGRLQSALVQSWQASGTCFL